MEQDEIKMLMAFILFLFGFFGCMIWAYGRGQQQGHTQGFEEGYKTGEYQARSRNEKPH